MTALRPVSPVSGWAASLAEIPDTDLADGRDGVVVDPSEPVLRAPCDGIILDVDRDRRLCSIRSREGIDLNLRVSTNGVAAVVFHVASGEAVRAGAPVMRLVTGESEFASRGLFVALTVVDSSNHIVADRVIGRKIEAGEPIMRVESVDTAARSMSVVGAEENAAREVRLALEAGLHARPAAMVAETARRHLGVVTVSKLGRSANAKSAVSLIALGAIRGDVLTVAAWGTGAAAIVDRLAADLSGGVGGAVAAVDLTGTTVSDGVEERPPFARDVEVCLKGVAAVPGVAIGPAVRLFHTPPDIPETGAGAAVELERFQWAVGVIAKRLDGAARAGGVAGEVFRAHRVLLTDPELQAAATERVRAGKSAERAWEIAIGRMVALLASSTDPRPAERAADLRDLERRMLDLLGGRDGERILTEFPQGAILVADEVSPSEIATMPRGRASAVCMAGGGATSHAVILAADLGIPTLVAVGDEIERVPDGAPLIVDGPRGEIRVFPSTEKRDRARAAVRARAARHEENRRSAREPCRTADGIPIHVFANIGETPDAALAAAEGAEGCGLLRTEFLLPNRDEAPSEEEQFRHYQSVVDAFGGNPTVIRVLDAGGDKPLAYMPLPREGNPALGVRGVRADLRRPEVLRGQLRAILRVRPFEAVRVLVPMVTSVAELRAVRAIAEAERMTLDRPEPISIGAMIEVPAAALTVDLLAEEADFLSIGTNDLTQYALAMDRANNALADRIDVLHPGVSRLIHAAGREAAARGRPLAVCGEAASDPAAVPVLIGLGVTELSVAPRRVADLKAMIRGLTMDDCRAAATLALAAESAEAARLAVARRVAAVEVHA